MHIWYLYSIYLIGLIACAVYFYRDSLKTTAEDSEMPFFIAVLICVWWPLVLACIILGRCWGRFCRHWDSAVNSKE